ncbi:TetR/AcrR family transcriptional regulator [Amycolatopsis cihanbeyliensis]|uniref:TetR family transcriptional regulator n=1 Tax=Amycolatopsis cihanbeyliensis TaxID=1128664 RepID=A0A542DMH9_AMYCI|nr:TetR/AcrR family transcriptional regulator [Amycolatopsis cihanbeyliensis]TQJ04302.1 TetR family transcriptional regulator [Amycolatopsis cihanbeyliensis]
MTTSRTARERARAELTREIKDEARRQLAQVGADGLSLRAVSRKLGMVSSALYRYFPSRDHLLTALIIDAYNTLGAAVEEAAAREVVPIEQWRMCCHAARKWARAHPHEYALIYGSPVPGYRAPQDTVEPAARVPLALVGVVRLAWGTTGVRPAFTGPSLSATLDIQTTRLAAQVAPELPSRVLTRVLIAWTQLFGMLSFELFGQLVGSVDPSSEFFAHAVEQMLEFVGLQ